MTPKIKKIGGGAFVTDNELVLHPIYSLIGPSVPMEFNKMQILFDRETPPRKGRDRLRTAIMQFSSMIGRIATSHWHSVILALVALLAGDFLACVKPAAGRTEF